METEWIEVCEHVSYKIHGEKLTIRAKCKELSELDAVARTTLPSVLAELLLEIRLHRKSEFNKLIMFFGHYWLTNSLVSGLALGTMMQSPEQAPILSMLLTVGNDNLFTSIIAAIKVMEMTAEVREKLNKDEERLRKLLGDEHS